jgi:hypothetical protein
MNKIFRFSRSTDDTIVGFLWVTTVWGRDSDWRPTLTFVWGY